MTSARLLAGMEAAVDAKLHERRVHLDKVQGAGEGGASGSGRGVATRARGRLLTRAAAHATPPQLTCLPRPPPQKQPPQIASVVAFLQIAMGALDAVARTGCRAVLFGSLALHAAHAWTLFGPAAKWYAARRGAAAGGALLAIRLLTALTIQGCNNPTSQARGAGGGAGKVRGCRRRLVCAGVRQRGDDPAPRPPRPPPPNTQDDSVTFTFRLLYKTGL
jgi:hypothetical protein